MNRNESYEKAFVMSKMSLKRGEVQYLITAYNPMDVKVSLVRNLLKQKSLKKCIVYKAEFKVGSVTHYEMMLMCGNLQNVLKKMKLFNQRAVFKIDRLNNRINRQIIWSDYDK